MHEPPPTPDPLVPLRVALRGRYDVLRELGRGGMGIVSLPDNHASSRTLALIPYSHQVAVRQKRKGRGIQQAPALSRRSGFGYAAALRTVKV